MEEMRDFYAPMGERLAKRGWFVRQSPAGNIVADFAHFRAYLSERQGSIKIKRNLLFATNDPKKVVKFIDENKIRSDANEL